MTDSMATDLATDRAYASIKRLVVTLELSPGDAVTEDQLVRVVGGNISKTPVRDALRRLVKEGFVVRDGRGYRIAPVTLRQTRDLYAMRRILETAALARAVERNIDLTLLIEVQQQARASYDPDDPDSIRQYLIESDRFHVALAELAGNDVLTQCLTNTIDQLHPVMHYMLRTLPPERLSLCSHDMLARTIAAGADRELATQALVDHIRTSEDLVIDSLLDLDNEFTIPPRKVLRSRDLGEATTSSVPPRTPDQEY